MFTIVVKFNDSEKTSRINCVDSFPTWVGDQFKLGEKGRMVTVIEKLDFKIQKKEIKEESKAETLQF